MEKGPVTHSGEMRSRSMYGSNSKNEKLQPVEDLMDYAKTYARQNPEMAALWCFGVGFVLGWKLKPW